MDALSITPPLEDLYIFIDKIKSYPISSAKLMDTARRLDAPKEVINFYGSFMPWRTFKNKDELIGCSEQVDIMRAERSGMPKEEERSPEEY
ncbi:hypothetical protein KW792_00420 [Candidatus Saccharibacteria bacterium]|nr:hypothetical protein [Candidatus Saccharibacteria bacterium]